MDIKQLRYFIAVAEELHFGRAARRLHITQPPLSQQIKALEESIGVRLLERDRRSVQLTAAGQELLNHARRIVNMLPLAAQAARNAQHCEPGMLRISCSGMAIFSAEVLSCISRYRQRYAAIETQFCEGAAYRQLDELLAGQLDLCFLTGPLSGAVKGLHCHLFSRERLVAALPCHHPLAKAPRLRLKDLAGEPFVALQKMTDIVLSERLTDIFREAGFLPQVVMEASGISSLLGLVGTGAGIAVIPASLTSLQMTNVVFRELDELTAYAELYAITRTQQALAIRNFLNFMQSEAVPLACA